MLFLPYSIRLFLSHIAVVNAGIYASYRCFKAIEGKNTQQSAVWLMFWSMLGALHAVEWFMGGVLFVIPFYTELRTAIILWALVAPHAAPHNLYFGIILPILNSYGIAHHLTNFQKYATRFIVDRSADVYLALLYHLLESGRIDPDHSRHLYDRHLRATHTLARYPSHIERRQSAPVHNNENISLRSKRN
eukprot:gb/GECH01008171.1/.p1 GENE.gb/GECH01008171.1/~~gb/GECH01008171.1/.p1  ORF type:complete len:190 (+),score=28.42 gb/GECH01008171.1/:1-570(+)